VSWLQQIRTGRDKANEYATREDFCRVFTENLDRLYQLSLLLTGDPEKAEQCFVGGLEDSVKANGPFKEWAHSWAKRVIIKNAIHELKPHSDTAGSSIVASPRKRSALESLLALGDVERFVFVMSVLERYSEKECSLLLGCSVLEIRTARIRALEQLASSLASTSRESDQVSSRPLAQDPKENDESQITHDDREAWLVA
jgi:DNA-directed RNA polymerase specialized sigma24 family protein